MLAVPIDPAYVSDLDWNTDLTTQGFRFVNANASMLKEESRLEFSLENNARVQKHLTSTSHSRICSLVPVHTSWMCCKTRNMCWEVRMIVNWRKLYEYRITDQGSTTHKGEEDYRNVSTDYRGARITLLARLYR
jgi:hypothetical protein